MRRKFSVSIVLALVAISLSVIDAAAFKTFTHFGGAVHEQITRAALVTGGPKISQESFTAIDNANMHQDIIDSTEFLDSKRHFDDCTFKEGLKHVDACYAAISKHLANADTNKTDWSFVLSKFGELLHPVQDFYSHSNYVELKLKANAALKPAQIPLVNWQSITPGVQTGFFFYQTNRDNELLMLGSGFLPVPEPNPNRDRIIPRLTSASMQRPGTRYLNSTEYANITTFDQRLNYVTDPKLSVLHRDLNKDNASAEESLFVNPKTNTSLYAYAINLAQRETLRQWKRLEGLVRTTCPDPKKAAAVITALRLGIRTTGDFKLTGPFIQERGNSTSYTLSIKDQSLTWTNTATGKSCTFTYDFITPAYLSVGDTVTFSGKLTGDHEVSPLITFLPTATSQRGGSCYVKQNKALTFSISKVGTPPADWLASGSRTWEIIDGKKYYDDAIAKNPALAQKFSWAALRNKAIVFSMYCSGGAGDKNVNIEWVYEKVP